MKNKKSIIVALVLLILVSAFYRVFPDRPWGFAPQIAMAIFGGAVFVNDKKWAFALPILSVFIGDLLFQFLLFFRVTPAKELCITESDNVNFSLSRPHTSRFTASAHRPLASRVLPALHPGEP